VARGRPGYVPVTATVHAAPKADQDRQTTPHAAATPTWFILADRAEPGTPPAHDNAAFVSQDGVPDAMRAGSAACPLPARRWLDPPRADRRGNSALGSTGPDVTYGQLRQIAGVPRPCPRSLGWAGSLRAGTQQRVWLPGGEKLRPQELAQATLEGGCVGVAEDQVLQEEAWQQGEQDRARGVCVCAGRQPPVVSHPLDGFDPPGPQRAENAPDGGGERRVVQGRGPGGRGDPGGPVVAA